MKTPLFHNKKTEESTGESRVSAEGVTKDLFDEIANWAPFMAYGAIAVIAIVLYFFAKKKSPEARNYTILTTAIGVIELVTDSLFIYDTYQLTSKSLFIASLVFIGLPLIVNLTIAFFVLKRELSTKVSFFFLSLSKGIFINNP